MSSRKITSLNYTATCAELICAFAAAIEADRRDRDDKDSACNGALELAETCGWDSEADTAFMRWALKATVEESLVEGLQKVLAAVKAQYEASLPAPNQE